MRRTSIASCLVALTVACGGSIELEGSDAGSGRDASTQPDAGPSIDAGQLDTTGDAGSIDDAGSVDIAPSVGCASGEGLAEGEHTFMLDGRQRLYRLRLPQGYSRDRAWPLVLALHPNGSSAGYWDGETGDRAIRRSAREDAIVLVAQAREGDWRGDLPAELGYFDYVIAELERELCIDQRRIFSMGFSGGGSFSGVLGCMRDDIRAIASGGAVTYFEPGECVGEPATWITIGSGELTNERAQFRDFWRERAGCAATSSDTEPSPCVAYDGCEGERPVHYCQHGGGHEWPVFGTGAAWGFFEQFL